MSEVSEIWIPEIIFGAVLLYAAIHSALASLRMKAWVQRVFDGRGARYYRLFYNLLAIITLLPVLALPGLLPDQTLYTIPSPYTWLALAVQGAALLVLALGVLQTGVWHFLGVQQVIAGEDAEEPAFVRTGLYRWMRHPLYSAALLFIWLVPQMTRNLFALNLGLTVYLIIGAMLEEIKLEHEFGERYRRYRIETPMFIPRLSLQPRKNAGAKRGISSDNP